MRETKYNLFVSWKDVVQRTRVISGFLKQTEDENKELGIAVVGPKYGALPILTLLNDMRVQTSQYRLFIFPDCLDSFHLRHSDLAIIVDDVYDTGKTTRTIEREVTKVAKPLMFLHAYLYIKELSPVTEKYVGQRVCNKWIVFPWEPSFRARGGRV